MKLGTDLKPLTIDYPDIEEMPKNLLNTDKKSEFKATHNKKPFLEQFSTEKHPHRIKHLHFQFGNINGKWATKLFLKKSPYRIVYSDENDPFLDDLIEQQPPRTKFPPNTSPSPIARSFREMGAKWVADRLFSSLEYMSFDEPRLYKVNPDLLIIPKTEANKIIDLTTQTDNEENQDPNNNHNGRLKEIEFDNACFIEVKAYHRNTIVGEKEVLQAFNYAVLGGKTMLLTTGTLGDLDTFEILNKNAHKHEKTKEGYDPKVFKKFVKSVDKKFKERIKKIDLRKGQDQYDTRGIYYSVKSKLKKMYKYTKDWPNKIDYSILSNPLDILEFLKSEESLGLVEPDAFLELLKSRNMQKEARLFKNVRTKFIEEIILNPTELYPK